MKIDISGGYGLYRKKVSGDAPKKGTTASGSQKASGTDVVEISRGNTAIADKSLLTLKSGIQNSISQPASAERLEELRAAIRAGTYRVSTEDLIDSILE